MPDHLLYGAAYYDEYLPYERLDRDFQLMTQAGMNTIRIAESTWSTWEPREGAFDFSRLHRVLEAAGRHGLSVIVGTPTYAIPPGWPGNIRIFSPIPTQAPAATAPGRTSTSPTRATAFTQSGSSGG